MQSGCVIGGDGFGYITDKKTGRHSSVLQAGNVVLEDEVEIGNNTCIDRATAGSTIVGAGTKIDNLVHLGHNDVLGKNCLVVAHVGISGSVTVGDNVTFAGQVGTVGISQLVTIVFLAEKQVLPIMYLLIRFMQDFRHVRIRNGLNRKRISEKSAIY